MFKIVEHISIVILTLLFVGPTISSAVKSYNPAHAV